MDEKTPEDRLVEAGYKLAVLAMQSDRFAFDTEFAEATTTLYELTATKYLKSPADRT